MPKKETIFVFSAHTDDFVIGAGGTITKYVQEGKRVIAVVFSLGEKSHPWLREKVIQKLRSVETIRAGKVLRCDVLFFNLRDQKIMEDYQEKNIEKKLLSLLKKNSPSKVFTHSGEDPHSDHKAVHQITTQLLQSVSTKPEVYIYSVWNPVSFKTHYPLLYIDITSTFSTKMKALKEFPSQRYNAIYPLMFLILFRAVKDGLKIRKKFAESFYRIQ